MVKVQSDRNSKGVATKPLTVTGNWLIGAILKRENELEIWVLNHIWDVDKVRETVANREDEVTFYCGGSRNFHNFIDLFHKAFVLDVEPKHSSKDCRLVRLTIGEGMTRRINGRQ